MTPLITVVVPTLRGMRWLPACLAALRAQTVSDHEVVVVDNASTDGSAEWLALQAGVRVIRNDANLGYAAGVNQGIRASTSPFVAVLNDDTEASPEWLAALLAEVDDARVGSVASLLVYADRPNIVQSAGVAMDCAAIAWDRLGGLPVQEAAQRAAIFGASGGAALYRRSMLDEIGMFDERFFAYLEDVDLAWRAQRAGWRCRYASGALVRHHTSATSGAGSPFKQRLIARNKVWLMAKHARLRELPLMVVFDAMAVVYATAARGNLHHVRGRVEAMARWSEFRRDRGAWRLPVVLASVTWPWRVARRMP